MSRVLLVVVVGLALVVSGCGVGTGQSGIAAMRPSEGRSGLYLSGTVAGRQIALTDGAPRLIVGDCDPQDPRDDDVCFVSRDIDGNVLRIIVENPAVLEAGTTVPVIPQDCGACDEVTDGIVVDLQYALGQRRRAQSGSVTVATVEPFRRYAGATQLTFDRGHLAGDFNVVPRPEE